MPTSKFTLLFLFSAKKSDVFCACFWRPLMIETSLFASMKYFFQEPFYFLLTLGPDPNWDTLSFFNIKLCSFTTIITVFWFLFSVGSTRQLVCLLECQLCTLLQLQCRWGLGESLNYLCIVHYVHLPGFSPVLLRPICVLFSLSISVVSILCAHWRLKRKIINGFVFEVSE